MSASSVRKEVEGMEYILSFVTSILARIAGYYVCKWLNNRQKPDK